MGYPNKPTFVWRIDQYKAGLRREFEKRAYRAAELVKNQVKINLSAPGRKHGASVPGEFPRAWTGLLRNSIQTKIEPESLRAWVYSNLNYALYLEFGTKSIHGREFLRRTLWELRDQVLRIYTAPLPALVTGRLELGTAA